MAGSESRSSRAPSSEHVGGRPTKIGAVATGPETERGSGAEHGEGEGKHHGGDSRIGTTGLAEPDFPICPPVDGCFFLARATTSPPAWLSRYAGSRSSRSGTRHAGRAHRSIDALTLRPSASVSRAPAMRACSSTRNANSPSASPPRPRLAAASCACSPTSTGS